MIFRTTPLSDEDIIGIYTRGAVEFGIEQAEAYHAGLIRSFALLAANPRMARQRTEFVPPVRMHPYRAHMIAYVEDEQGILIIRVLHGRQDWPRYL